MDGGKFRSDICSGGSRTHSLWLVVIRRHPYDHEPQKKVLKHFMCELDLI